MVGGFFSIISIKAIIFLNSDRNILKLKVAYFKFMIGKCVCSLLYCKKNRNFTF